MKKLISGLSALAIAAALAPMSAFAENETGGTTNVSFKAVIEPAYTITIPASVDFSSGTGTATIKAENVYLDTTKHKQINVTLDSASHTESGAEFNAKNSAKDSTVTYTISKGEDSISIGDTVASFVTSESETEVQTQDLTFAKTGTPTYAGTHTETLTFGIAVEDAAAANPYQAIATASVGDVVNFKWNDADMNWIVISNDNAGNVELLAQSKVTDMAFSTNNSNVWADSQIRTYLNGDDFYGKFGEDEKSLIKETTLSDVNTTDNVFLLSTDEANRLLTEEQRAIGSWWWLRSPGIYSYTAAVVFSDGSVNTIGNYVANENGVRPALNLKILNP